MPAALSRIKLIQILNPREVITSSEAAARLKNRLGLSDVYSRQIVSRQSSENGIWRSENLKLPKNERLVARSSFVGSLEFFEQSAELLKTARPGVARCLKRLADGAVMHRVQIMKLLASPLEDKQGARRPAIDSEIEALSELGVVHARVDTAFECFLGKGIASGSLLDEKTNEARLSLRKESLLARILGDFLRRMNLVSWGRIQVGNEAGFVPFNNQPFSAIGFNYLDPLSEWKAKDKPTGCPVLIDVLSDRCTIADFASFRDRLMKATHRGEKRQRSLGVIAAKDFELPALKAARSAGFVTINFRQLYGDKALEALNSVSKLLGIAGDDSRQADLGIPTFGAMLEELKTNPVVVEIRSIAFEAVVGLILQESENCHSIRLGLNAPFYDKEIGAQTTRDVDVFGLRGDKAWVVECKAYHEAKTVDFSEIKRFYSQVIPAFLEWHTKNVGRLTECTAEFWTTGLLPEDAQSKLDDLLKNQKFPSSVKMNFQMRDGALVMRSVPFALETQCVKLLKAIATHESPEEVVD